MTTIPYIQNFVLTDAPQVTALIDHMRSKSPYPDEISYKKLSQPRVVGLYKVQLQTVEHRPGYFVIRVSGQGIVLEEAIALVNGSMPKIQSSLYLKYRVSVGGRDVIKLVPIISISRLEMSGVLPVSENDCRLVVEGMAKLNGVPTMFKMYCTMSTDLAHPRIRGILNWH